MGLRPGPSTWTWTWTAPTTWTSPATSYTVKATSVADPGKSASAVLTVTSPVSVNVSPSTVSLQPGAAQTFSATVTGTTNSAVTWSCVGGSLSATTGPSVTWTVQGTGGGTVSTGGLYTAPATAGTYHVIATSQADPSKTATATLTVSPLVAPSITTQPSNQTVTAPATASFTVVASGTAPLSYQWYKNTVPIAGATAASYTTPATTTADSGSTFAVTVNNSAGGVLSVSATLTVNAAPTAPSITAQPLGQTVTAGVAATFSVSADGTAPLSYQWKKGGSAIAGATQASYTTPATTLADNGSSFTVDVSNSAGTTTSNPALLTVNPPTLGALTWKRDVIYLGSKEVAEIENVNGIASVNVALTDHLGSPRFQVRGDGTVIEQKFAPFGESLTDPTTMSRFAKGFTNHEQTDPSGLIYMQARFYAPMYHRFLSPDPARDQHFEFTQSWNIYSYVMNNPVMATDPTGMLLTEEQRKAWLRDGDPAVFGTAGGAAGYAANSNYSSQAQTDKQAQTGANTAATSSWTPSQPLPKDPSGLGPDWRPNPDHKNPNGEQWVNDKTGEKLDFDKAQPGKTGEKAEDHWHHTPKGEKKGKAHHKPGDVIQPKGSEKKSSRVWDFIKSIPPRPVAEAGTAAIIIYVIISEGSRVIPARNLVPVP